MGQVRSYTRTVKGKRVVVKSHTRSGGSGKRKASTNIQFKATSPKWNRAKEKAMQFFMDTGNDRPLSNAIRNLPTWRQKITGKY